MWDWLQPIIDFFGGGGDLGYDTSQAANTFNPSAYQTALEASGALMGAPDTAQYATDAWNSAFPDGFYPGFAPQLSGSDSAAMNVAAQQQPSTLGQIGDVAGSAASIANTLSPFAALALASNSGSGGKSKGIAFPTSGGGSAQGARSSGGDDTGNLEDIPAGVAPQFFASQMDLPLNDYLEMIKRGQA